MLSATKCQPLASGRLPPPANMISVPSEVLVITGSPEEHVGFEGESERSDQPVAASPDSSEHPTDTRELASLQYDLQPERARDEQL